MTPVAPEEMVVLDRSGRIRADSLTRQGEQTATNEREGGLVLDPVKIERAESEIDKFISSRSKQREEANALAAIEKAEDARKLQEMRKEHRVLWVEHYRRLAFASLQNSRDYRARARALERGEIA